MIYYLADFHADQVSGGIRVLHRHVEALNRHGIEAVIVSRGGRPTWFRSDAPLLPSAPEDVSPQDHAVFPEAFLAESPIFAAFLEKRLTKHLFCQNHFYAFIGADACARPRHFGIDRIFASSREIARFLSLAFGHGQVPIVPCAIDTALFHPERKSLAIACMPRKQGFFLSIVRELFKHRHPDLTDVEWIEIDGCSESEASAVLRRSAIFLSLSHFEGLGLPPLEAMASGCLIAGLHGSGGREYACATNGLWFDAEAPLECADGLATLARGFKLDAPFTHALRAGGMRTAARYSEEHATAALLEYFAEARPQSR